MKSFLHIHSLSPQYNGRGTNNGQSYEIPFTLPGETCIPKTGIRKGKTVFALPKHIIHPSSERGIASCRHFGTCAGCHLQHVSYAKSLSLKQEGFLRSFLEVTPSTLITIPIIGARDPFFYRNTARFDVRNGKIMLHTMLTQELFPLQQCHTVSTGIAQSLQQLNGYLPHDITELEIKENKKGEQMLILIGDSIPTSLPITPTSLYVFDHNQRLLHKEGTPWLTHELIIQDTTCLFHIGPDSFFQVHTYMAEQLFSYVMRHIPKQGFLLDLYAGTGTMGIIAGKLYPQLNVHCVEINEEMVALGKENAHFNKVKNISFDQHDVRTLTFSSTPEAIIIDPPRKGMTKESIEHLSSLGAKKIIYVSCSPQTFLRDIQYISKEYTLTHLQLFDMTPYTSHLEVVGVWERQLPVNTLRSTK